MSACGIEGCGTEHAGVHVRLAGSYAKVEVQHPPDAHVEDGLSPANHRPVENQRGVRPTLVLLDPLHDGVAADLFLAVEGEAHVDRKLARSRKLPHGLDEQEQVPLVVGDSAREEAAVAPGELERRRLPELERVGRLHVEVRVAEHRRGRLGAFGGGNLADHEWPAAVPRDEFGRAASAPNPLGNPLRRPVDVAGVGRVRADGRDGDQLGEPLEKLIV